MSGPSKTNAHDEPDALIQEAGAWFARMHSDQVTSADETAFMAWLTEDEHHQRAYEQTAAVWNDLEDLRGMPEMAPVLAHLSTANDEHDTPTIQHQPSRRRWLSTAAAGVGIAALTGAGWFGLQSFASAQTYETGFGEQRRVALDDGSTLMLNTETKIRVHFTQAERRLWLDHGQAYFIVAPDRARPFRVFAGDEEVRALGTQFEVRRETTGMKVTLEEGSVAIIRNASQEIRTAASPPSQPAAVLTPGQQATIEPDARIQLASVDTRRVTAWRFGQMALDADQLQTAISEINRYNTKQIVLDDAALGAMPISGLFQTGSPDAFVEALQAVLPVEIARQDDRSIHLRRISSQ